MGKVSTMSDARKGLYRLLKRDAEHAEKATERHAGSKISTPRDYQRYVGDSFKALNDTIKELENRTKTLELRVFPCNDCCLSSCEGCPHKEDNL